MADLLISEVFGPTLQGEGPDTGKPCLFLRLYGCPVQCAWCDTKYTWAPGTSENALLSNTDTLAALLEDRARTHQIDRLVISGGEPMAQARALHDLIRAPQMWYFHSIEIETSGVRRPDPLFLGHTFPFVRFNVSPKLVHANARVPYDVALLRSYARLKARFKFVVKSVDDFAEIDNIVTNAHVPLTRVWIMPEGVTEQAQLDGARALVDDVIKRGYNLTLRTHILLWGNERGR